MATPNQAEVNRRVREWVALFLGDGANPVLDGADTLAKRDAARDDGAGSLHATVLDVSHFPMGAAHRDGQSRVWHEVEAEYSIQFFWHGRFGVDANGHEMKQVAQSEASDFVLWAQSPESLEQLQRGDIAFQYVAGVVNLTDNAVTEAERQDRAGVDVRVAYTQQHERRPSSILSIEGLQQHGIRGDAGNFDDSSVYDVRVGGSD